MNEWMDGERATRSKCVQLCLRGVHECPLLHPVTHPRGGGGAEAAAQHTAAQGDTAHWGWGGDVM